MLQRGAQEGVRKAIAVKKLSCKLSYGTAAKHAEDPDQAGRSALLNAFISRAEPDSTSKTPDVEDVVNSYAGPLPPDLQSIAVKDNITTHGSETTCGSGILRDHWSPFEADIVSHLRQGGASVYGKTNLDEFGMGSHSTNSFYGPVRNFFPFESYSAGGSSGGSAVAVASGQCPIALGTDTGGSVRLPAAYTGIVGFKPSYGAISRWGVIPYANSMDTVGIMASHTKPLRQVFHWTRQHDPRDPTSLSEKAWARLTTRRREARKEERRRLALGDPQLRSDNKHLRGIRIGVPLEYNIAELDPGIRQAWRDCLVMLRRYGCIIVPISLPNTKHALSTYYILAPAEAASNLAKYDGIRYGSREGSTDREGDVLYSKTRGTGFGDEVKRRILLGSYTLSSEAVDNYFLKAQKVRRLVQQDFDRAFLTPNPLRPPEQFNLSDMDESIQMSNKLGPTQVDYIVCPTAPTLPPTLDDLSNRTPVDSYMNDVFTVPASLAGLPAISIPFPIPKEFQIEGKPVVAGIQIIGQYSSDYGVITMGEHFIQKQEPVKYEIGKPLSSELLRSLVNKHREARMRKRIRRLLELAPTWLKEFDAAKRDLKRSEMLELKREGQEQQPTIRRVRIITPEKSLKVKTLVKKRIESKEEQGLRRAFRGTGHRFGNYESMDAKPLRPVEREILWHPSDGGPPSKLTVYRADTLPVREMIINQTVLIRKFPSVKGDDPLQEVPGQASQICEVPSAMVRKHFSSKSLGPSTHSLPRSEGDLFLASSGEEGNRFGAERPAGQPCTEGKNNNALEKPLEEKIRRVYVVPRGERTPLTEKEISKAFEDAWAKWEEQTPSSPP